MKVTLLARTLANEFASRDFARPLDRPIVADQLLSFLVSGGDIEDRAQALRLALLESNRRSVLVEVLQNAQDIFDWPKPRVEPKPEPKPEPVQVAKAEHALAPRRGRPPKQR